jgi:DNA helicase-2/ATP-dependent DNA helicase PcrA
MAAALGAAPSSHGAGDVRLPDGTVVWLDGGPARFTPPVDGVPVLHRVQIEHGSLQPPRGNHTTAELAPDQLAAVTHPDGAARIVAPAGSGKTRVLTERARHLLRQWNLPPGAVCLVAYNKRAQEEMQQRTADLRGLQVRTLNAIALAIVNGSPPFHPRQSRVATIGEPEVRRLIGRLVTFPRRRNADPVATWIEALSSARLGLRSPADVEADYSGDVEGFKSVLPRYRAELARAGQADFDEQVLLAVELLLTMPSVRAAAQRACRVMLVDEFQDLTPAHLLLVRLLAGPDGCVFGVGDDDQTIYGYNGADPAWLIDFADLFPGAGDHPLQTNYRCPGGIVRAADTLLRHNLRRVPKIIRSERALDDGFVVAPPTTDTVGTTLGVVQQALAAGTPAAGIAVLTRVNALLAPVQAALVAAGVPCTGGVGAEFLERTAVRAALAWLRLACSGERFGTADIDEAVRRPSRSLHPRVADWAAEQTSLDGIRRLAGRVNTPKDAATLLDFAADIEVLQAQAATGAPTAALLSMVFDQIGLAGTVAGLDATRHGMNRASQNDDLTALAQLAALQPDPVGFGAWLHSTLSNGSAADGVTLATVHRVKGQEWPVVMVHHAADDQFPHRLATDTEEERRLFHVAITRASQEVTVVAGDHPSPFVLDCSTEPSARPPARATRAPQPARATPAAPNAADTALFERLREWRRQAAAGKPAFTVFTDDTLRAIAAANPTSLDGLRRIKGVGPTKLEQYGAAVLAVLSRGT